MADLKAFAEQLVNLTVKEVNELAQILKDVYGIEPAAAAVSVAAGPVAATEVVEEVSVELSPAEMRSKADALYKEAAKLRKEADEIDPPKSKKATKETV